MRFPKSEILVLLIVFGWELCLAGWRVDLLEKKMEMQMETKMEMSSW